MQAYKPSLIQTFFNYCAKANHHQRILNNTTQVSLRTQRYTTYHRRSKYKQHPNSLGICAQVSKCRGTRPQSPKKPIRSAKVNELLSITPAIMYTCESKNHNRQNSSEIMTRRSYSRIKTQRGESNKILYQSVSVQIGQNTIRNNFSQNCLQNKVKLRPSSAQVFGRDSLNRLRSIKIQLPTHKKGLLREGMEMEETPRAWETNE